MIYKTWRPNSLIYYRGELIAEFDSNGFCNSDRKELMDIGYEKATRKDLFEVAKKKKISNYSNMTNEKLFEAISCR